MSESTRGYLYRISLAVLVVLGAYGILGPDEIPVWTGVIVAVLGIGNSALATANTTVRKTGNDNGQVTLASLEVIAALTVAAAAVIFTIVVSIGWIVL